MTQMRVLLLAGLVMTSMACGVSENELPTPETSTETVYSPLETTDPLIGNWVASNGMRIAIYSNGTAYITRSVWGSCWRAGMQKWANLNLCSCGSNGVREYSGSRNRYEAYGCSDSWLDGKISMSADGRTFTETISDGFSISWTRI